MPPPAQGFSKLSPQKDTVTTAPALSNDALSATKGVLTNPTAIIFDLELQPLASSKGPIALVTPENMAPKASASTTLATRLRLPIELVEKLECLPDSKMINKIPKELLEKAPKTLEITSYSAHPDTKLALGFYGLYYQKGNVFCVYSNLDISKKINTASKLLYLIKLKNDPHFWLIAGSFDYE